MTTHTHPHTGEPSPRLRRAVLTLPVANAGQRLFLSRLQEMLAPQACMATGSGLLPSLRIAGGSSSPHLAFDDACRLMLEPAPAHEQAENSGTTHAVIGRHTPAPQVPLEQIVDRLEGAVLRLNHIGVNVPETSRSKSGWDETVARLGASEWLYRLETGSAAEILFLLPVTPEEHASGTLATERQEAGSMIELCCGDDTPGFTLHFNLETRLTRAELLQRFSGNGVFKPGDEAFFLSVCAASPWAGLTIYFDLSFADPGSVRTSRGLIMSLGRRQP